MSRLPGLGVARTLAALVFLAAVVGVGVFALAPTANGPGDAPPSATDMAGLATPTPAVSPTATAPGATKTPGSPAASEPSGEVIAFTNPDGPNPADYPPDGYPFIEQAQLLPTYAGLWVDQNQRDFHVAVTGNIAGAIEALKAGIPRGITVYFHIAQYTEAQICALRDAMFADRAELMRHGIILSWGGCGNSKNRVNVGMSPTSPEAIAYMQRRYPGPVDYENGGAPALRQFDPPEGSEVRLIAIREGADPGLLTCGRRPFPESALDSPPIDSTASGPAVATLREALGIYVDVYGDLSGLGWILAEHDQYGATFLADRGDTWLEAPAFAGTNGWVPGTIDYCSPRVLSTSDGDPASWSLDPAFPEPTRNATELHVLVEEQACASASSPASRMLPPVVTYGPSTMTVTVRVRPVGGVANCPGNPSLPVTIALPEPLGDRRLVGNSQLQ